MSGVPCSSCSRDLPPGDIIELWDGRRYCRACTDKTCPALFEYAETHPVLEDASPAFSRAHLRYWLKFAMMLAAMLALFAAFTAPNRADALVVGLFVAIGAFVVFGVLTLVQGFLIGELNRPRVLVQRGKVTVVTTGWWIIPIPQRWECNLFDCRWTVGRESLALQQPLPNLASKDPVLLLKVPRRRLGILYPTRIVPCASNPQMRAIWVRFLTLAGIPEWRPFCWWTRKT